MRKAGAKPAELPLVLTEKVKGATRLAAVSRDALAIGLSPGMTLADARARIPDLWVEEADPVAEADLLQRMAEDCDRFTPVVAIDPPNGLMLDITGCEHLFDGEAELRRSFSERFHRAGLHVRTVIANSAGAARALARHGRIAIVPPGGDEAAVRSLPIVALELDEDDRIAISRAGLKIIAHLADRPSLAFAARFGEVMTLRLSRTLGREETPMIPLRPAPMLWVERRFPEPIGRSEDVEAVLAELGQEAAERLGERREGGRTFEASFFRADGAVRRISVETGRSIRNVKVVLRLFRERLDALADPLDPGFGFDLIRLAVPETEPLDAIQAGLDGRAIEEDEIADLADRLATRFGADRVMRFVAQDTHDPDRAVHEVPAGCNTKDDIPWGRPESGEPPSRPVQVFDPPQPVETTAEVPDGPPLQFTWRRVMHRVKRAEGPERIAPEWWRRGEGAQTRDYYRIEDSEGRRFWLFRAGIYDRETNAPRWYLHGLFP